MTIAMVLAPQVSARVASPRLDARLAAGDDPFWSAVLALRGVYPSEHPAELYESAREALLAL